MSQQRFAALSALGGTLFLIGSVAALAGLGAGIPNDRAATTKFEDGRVSFSDRFSEWPSVGVAATEPRQVPLPAASPAAVAPANPPEPVQEILEAATPSVETAARGSAAVPEPQIPPATPPAIVPASASDPVQEVVEAAASPIETAALVSAAVPEPAATPTIAIAPANTPDPVQEIVEADPPSFELAATGSAVVLEPQMPRPTAPPVAIVPSTPDPVQENAAIESDGANPRPPVRLVSLFRPESPTEDLKPAMRPVETPNECLVVEICIDDYLWSFYQLTPKVDTNKVVQRIKTTVKKKGKTRTVTRTIVRYVAADFTWKDPIAAQKAGMSLKDYVIGGMDRRFKLKLYHAFRAMEDAGLMPGITSAFRDDYRQSIASGNKAASDSSYHGGSRRGGYGHGLAADLVSLKGETRQQRWVTTVELWKWIDARENELGIGRPYLHRDPPHVGPIDGKEFADKRGGAKAKRAGPATNKRRPVVAASDPGGKNPAPKAGPVRVGSI
jgi:hypothetical protein